MRSFAGILAVFTLSACVPTARVILPASAPVAPDVEGPPLEVGPELSDAERAASPFRADDITPCKDGEDRAAAAEALRTVSEEITALDEGATLAQRDKAQAKLTALLKTPCFELAAADLPEELSFDSAWALHDWWTAGNGEQAIAQYVEPNIDRYFIAPASPRHSLLLQTHPDHPLAPLLCPETDLSCGHETEGWMRRAEDHFRPRVTNPAEDDCERSALAADPTARWTEYRACKIRRVDTDTTFPLGRFRAMNDGWLVVTNPYGSCAGVEMFDLANGTSVQTSTCTRNGLATVEIGRVPLATIREAAWTMAIANYMESEHRPSDQFMVPPGVVLGRAREEAEAGHLHGHHSTRSRQLLWTWYRPQNGKLVGQVTGLFWDAPSHDAWSYARELYDIAKNSVVKGCAPAFSAATMASFAWDKPGLPVRPDRGLDLSTPPSPQLVAARTELSRVKAPSRCTMPM